MLALMGSIAVRGHIVLPLLPLPLLPLHRQTTQGSEGEGERKSHDKAEASSPNAGSRNQVEIW